ncbi:hypothetical protein L249_8266, partial [Ophiocordyceps polyrhachis-furcata BCC 54312]
MFGRAVYDMMNEEACHIHGQDEWKRTMVLMKVEPAVTSLPPQPMKHPLQPLSAWQAVCVAADRWAGNVVDVEVLLRVVVGVIGVICVDELEVGLSVFSLAEGVGLVDLGVFGELAVGFEGASFVGG